MSIWRSVAHVVVPEEGFEPPRPCGPPSLSRLRLPFRHSGARGEVEATTGFEPVNRGFADLRVEPLHHVASALRPPDCRTGRPPARPSRRAGCPPRIRTSPNGSKVRCPTTRRGGNAPPHRRRRQRNGAEDGTRTRDPHLGKVMLYQLSHFRSGAAHTGCCWCREPESNWRHRDFQSRALPTELSRLRWTASDGASVTASGRIARAFRRLQSSPARAAISPWARGCSPVSSRSRLIRSTIGGCVEKRPLDRASNFLIGFVK